MSPPGGTIRAVALRVLEWRGIPVPEHLAERLASSDNPAQLGLWAQRAVRATYAEDLFAEE
ncbi:hypothetical protein ABZ847_07065 [Streptomyces bauhiniae]